MNFHFSRIRLLFILLNSVLMGAGSLTAALEEAKVNQTNGSSADEKRESSKKTNRSNFHYPRKTYENDKVSRLYLSCLIWDDNLEEAIRALQSASGIEFEQPERESTLIQLVVKHQCNENDRTRILIELKRLYGDVDARGKFDTTALHTAASEENVDALRTLIRLGADINVQDKYGRTPLHCASSGGKLESVIALLEMGADVSIRDEFGRTPLGSVQAALETTIAFIDRGFEQPTSTAPLRAIEEVLRNHSTQGDTNDSICSIQ